MRPPQTHSDRDLTAVLRVVKSGRAKGSLVQQHLKYHHQIIIINIIISVSTSLSPTLSWSVKEYSEADWFLIRLTTLQTIRHGGVEIPFNHRQEFLLSHRLQVRIRNAKIGRHAAVFPGHRCRPRERRRGRGRPEYRIMKLSGTNLVQYDYWIIRPPDISSQLSYNQRSKYFQFIILKCSQNIQGFWGNIVFGNNISKFHWNFF